MSRPITEDIQAFVREYLHSHEALEALLLLRADPDRAWPASVVAAKLTVQITSAEEALEQLRRDRALDLTADGYRYRRGDAGWEALVDRFTATYAENRVDILGLMTRFAIERVRDSVAKAFSDAFLMGRKKDG